MTDIKFYEARKKEARDAYNAVMLSAKILKESQDDIEQIVRTAIRFSTKMVRDGRTEEDVFALNYTMVLWYKEAMPFYRVYPAFQKQLSTLGEDFLDNLNTFDFDIDRSLKAIAIEFPISNEQIHVCELIAALKKGPRHTKAQPDIYMYLNLWYKEYGEDKYVSSTLNVTFESDVAGDSFRQCFPQKGVTDLQEIISKALRTYAAIIAIGDNPDLLQPIPLSKDRNKYEETLDPKFITRAKQRGVFGFEVGKILEDEEQIYENIKQAGGTVAPHYRKSHLAWQPHGPGNSLRKIILKKGSHVNFEKAKKVPMGYYGQKKVAE